MGKALKQIYEDNDRKNLLHIGYDLFRLLLKHKNPKKLYYYPQYLMYKKNREIFLTMYWVLNSENFKNNFSGT